MFKKRYKQNIFGARTTMTTSPPVTATAVLGKKSALSQKLKHDMLEI